MWISPSLEEDQMPAKGRVTEQSRSAASTSAAAGSCATVTATRRGRNVRNGTGQTAGRGAWP